MTFLLIVAIILSAIAYAAAFKLHRKWRLLAAAITFVVMSVAPYAYFVFVGEH